jgi:hypothetical protein
MSDNGESSSRFYDSPWFKGSAAVVALLVGVAALAGPLRSVVDDLFSGAPLPRNETEIVFDHGADMNTKIGQDATKLTKAKSELKRVVSPITEDGLALRTFGGKCNTAPQEPVVPFGANHNDDVIDHVNQLGEGSGKSNLYGAVTAAVQDFNDLPSDTVKNVYVYVGGIDTCGAATATATADDIKHILADRDIKTSFKFFTFDLSSEDQTALDAFKSVLPNTETVPIGSGEQLSSGG